jgi:hypothetical protein
MDLNLVFGAVVLAGAATSASMPADAAPASAPTNAASAPGAVVKAELAKFGSIRANQTDIDRRMREQQQAISTTDVQQLSGRLTEEKARKAEIARANAANIHAANERAAAARGEIRKHTEGLQSTKAIVVPSGRHVAP